MKTITIEELGPGWTFVSPMDCLGFSAGTKWELIHEFKDSKLRNKWWCAPEGHFREHYNAWAICFDMVMDRDGWQWQEPIS